jgi:hypothetical protein
MLRRGLAPATLPLAAVIVTWLVSGVAPFDIIRFAAYEVIFVAAPGAALLWAVRTRRSGPLVTVALGFPLGQALEILAFSATAAAGLRGLFDLYPVVVIGLSAAVIWRRRRYPGPETSPAVISSTLLWGAAGALTLGLVYLALQYLPTVPLPSATSSVAYDADFPFSIGLIGQVLHHWPTTSPGLSGSPLGYEWFVFFHMAAVAQVTGLAVPTIALRLDYVPTMVVIACQLLVLGRFFGRSAWTGVVAIVVVFLLGPLDLTTDASGSSPFFDLFSNHLLASWTFPFGLLFFLALLYLIGERLQAQTWRTRGDLGSWVLIALLMIGASGAKATILPVLITGAGMYGVVVLLFRRTVPMAAVVSVGLGIVIFAATFYVVYGGGVPGTSIQPLVAVAQTAPVVFARGINHPSVRAIALPIAYLAGFAGMLLPLAGTLYLLRRRHHGEITRFGICLCMLAAGLLIANLVHQVGYSELYFQDTGYAAGCLVAAMGLRLAWNDAGSALPGSRRALMLAFAAWVVVLVGVVAVTSRALVHPDALVVRYIALAAGCVGFVAVCGIVMRARHRPSTGVVALGLIPLVAAAALTSPIELSPAVHRLVTGAPITAIQPDPQVVWGLTPGLLSALDWLDDNSSTGAVIAVSNHWINPEQTDGRNFYYSAFAQRQVFVEAYDPIRYGISTVSSTAAGREYTIRQELNDAVFSNASATALDTLVHHYGVQFLFVDRIHAGFDPAVLQLGRIVYSDHDATIVAVG